MAIPGIRNTFTEGIELITNADLVASANELLGGIDLDPASSQFANQYVQAKKFYTPTDDGLNEQPWFDSVYLFPPSGTYFWDLKNQKWKLTRTTAKSLRSSHAVWFAKLYKSWLLNEIEQGLFFTNCPDIIRYDQKIFDFPVCILRVCPTLLRRKDDGVINHKTSTSVLVYLQPKDRSGEATQRFIDIYSTKGRVLA